MAQRLGQLFAAMTWLLIAGSLIIITGGLFGRPLLLAAVPTGSMVPALKPGDLIVVLPTWTMGAPGLGDVVVFKTPKDPTWIVHRIIDGNSAEGFITQGDANLVSDPNRVEPEDIAGIVPQSAGNAWRLPRLGAFRFTKGPLSSPVVAGVAMVLGIYLLVTDTRPRSRRAPGLGGGKGAHRHAGVLHLYMGLAVTAFLTTLVPAWTLSEDREIRYEIAESQPVQSTKANRYLLGAVHQEPVLIKNPSPLPVVVTFATHDRHVTYRPWTAVIPPKGQRAFQAEVANPNVGEHRSQLHMGVYLPLLPPVLLGWLAKQHVALAALATASVPAVIVLVLACFDRRSYLALAQWRVRLWAKLQL